MKNNVRALLVFIFAFSVSGQTSATRISEFERMAGCWERKNEDEKLLTSEIWMSPAGTSMLGMGRTVKNDKTTAWEYMRIEQRGDAFFFVAKPHTAAVETEFKLVKSSAATGFVFENDTHDFPQRVIYKVKGKKMDVRIEGKNEGKFLGIDFPFDKVACG